MPEEPFPHGTLTIPVPYVGELVDHIDTLTFILRNGLGGVDPALDATLRTFLDGMHELAAAATFQVPAAYTFAQWADDLKGESTPAAAALAEKVLTSLDSLMGAY